VNEEGTRGSRSSTEDVKIVDSGLHFLFALFTLFYFFFFFLFLFLFLEQLRLGVISHAVTSVTKLMAYSQD